jgi:hypothetical protein
VPYVIVWILVITLITLYAYLRYSERRTDIIAKSLILPPLLARNFHPLVHPLLLWLFRFSPFSLHPCSLLTASALFAGLVISLYRVRNSDPGVVSAASRWGPHADVAALGCIETKANGCARFCRKTGLYKPDRAHYCRATDRLVLRFDHHCIFVDASVGYGNHKFFLLFLLYTHLAGLFMGISCFAPMNFIAGLRGARLLAMFIVFVFSVAVSLSIIFFLGFHVFLVLNGTTTLEYTEKQGQIIQGRAWRSPYKVSPLLALTQVLGADVECWLVPTAPVLTGDGTVFPVNDLAPVNKYVT